MNWKEFVKNNNNVPLVGNFRPLSRFYRKSGGTGTLYGKV